jgi:hypothetical protein
MAIVTWDRVWLYSEYPTLNSLQDGMKMNKGEILHSKEFLDRFHYSVHLPDHHHFLNEEKAQVLEEN